MSALAAHEVLRAMKECLLTRGWCQNFFYGEGGELCTMGSLFAVDDRWQISNAAWSDVLEALHGQIGAAHLNAIPLWNDHPDRTFDEVVAVLDEAMLSTAPKDTPEPSPSVTHVFA